MKSGAEQTSHHLSGRVHPRVPIDFSVEREGESVARSQQSDAALDPFRLPLDQTPALVQKVSHHVGRRFFQVHTARSDRAVAPGRRWSSRAGERDCRKGGQPRGRSHRETGRSAAREHRHDGESGQKNDDQTPGARRRQQREQTEPSRESAENAAQRVRRVSEADVPADVLAPPAQKRDQNRKLNSGHEGRRQNDKSRDGPQLRGGKAKRAAAADG